MMVAIRWAFAAGAALLLAGGYAASQWAAFQGTAASYAARADSPVVIASSLVLLLGAVVLALVPDRGGTA